MDLVEELGVEQAPSVEDLFRPSLVKRARKREAYPTGNGRWVVPGDEKLSDAYPFYTIEEGEDGYHYCTCATHEGGQYRRVCTHVIAVMLAKESGEVSVASEPSPLGEEEPPAHTPAPPPGTHGSDSGVVREQHPRHPAAELALDPRDPSWGDPFLPEWVREFRAHQVDAIVDVIEAYERGAKVVFLDAPTGSGKTLIAEAVRRMIGGHALYTCTTKTLQDQVARDYPYASVLKGRQNYPTRLAPFPDVNAADCTGQGGGECNWCPERYDCPYQIAKAEALGNQLSVLNTAYALTAWNGPHTFTGRELVVMDECDLLERALMEFVEVRISRRKQERYKIGQPEIVDRRKVNTHGEHWREDWLRWVNETMPVLRRSAGGIPEGTTDIREIRELRWLAGMMANLSILKEELEEEDRGQWVLDIDRQGAVVFKPVEVSKFGQRFVWGHGQRFLLMSASIVSAQEIATSLGLEDEEWEVVSVPSTFPVENRPIYAMFAGKVTYKTWEAMAPTLADYIAAILEYEAGKRTLIHTHSYPLTQAIERELRGRGVQNVMSYSDAHGRSGVLERMKLTPGAVVLAPSFDRGVDLPYDLCEVQIIAKVPYPYMKDKQVNARMNSGHEGRQWFAVQVARSLVQMTGRGVRSADDKCATYILDKMFHEFWKSNRRLFPEWWKEAVDWTGRARSRVGV